MKEINISLKPSERESLLDEISDMSTESIMKHYPLIQKLFGRIKESVIENLKE